MPEFRISSLRFNYVGTWGTATTYNRDAVVTYSGKMYVCIVPHTASADFYTDLYKVTAGANTPYWNLLMDGHSWRTAWQPTTLYSLGNIVTYGGTVFICITNHTSGSIIDLTKFNTLATYSNWNSAWTTNKGYGVGDIVKYGGIVYVCNTLHTSAATAALGLEADQAKWAVINNGVEYKGAWTALTRYKTNDLVKIGPDVYISTSGHTSTTTFNSGSNWTLYIPGEEYAGTWGSSSVYQPGDVVSYGGYDYISTSINNTNNIPSVDSVNWNIFNQGYSVQNDWTNSTAYKIGSIVRRNGQLFVARADSSAQDPALSTVTVNYNSTGSSGTTLVANTIFGVYPGMIIAGSATSGVTTITSGYISGQTVVSASLTSTATTTVTNAQTTKTATGTAAQTTIVVSPDNTGLVVGMSVSGTGIGTNAFIATGGISGTTITLTVANAGVVSGTITFGANAITVGSSSGISANQGVSASGVPGTAQVSSVVSTTVILNTAVGAVSGNGTFGTPTIITNASPDTSPTNGALLSLVGLNYAYWNLINTGVNWASFWINGTQYVVGDLVIYQNATYRCIQNHIASFSIGGSGGGTRPDQDTYNAFWTIYTLHARNNALTNQGDIVTRNTAGTGNTAVPVGINQYTLKTNVNQPAWYKALVTNNVYYVSSTNGTDRTDYGTTWDQPWKTIKYACNFVGAGTQYPFTNAILTANKTYITTEVLQWMLYQKANAISPFTTNATWDQTKTVRDTGLILDALQYDITRGGNSQTVASALSFFAQGTINQYINTNTATAMPYLIASLNYAYTTLIPSIISQGAGTSYQSLMGIGTAFTTSASSTITTLNLITVGDTTNMSVGQAIQFTGTTFGGITSGQTYYVLNKINSTTITVTATQFSNTPVALTSANGTMTVTNVGTKINQTTGLTSAESSLGATSGVAAVQSLLSIITTALSNQSTVAIPAPNTGLTATIFVKTGTYSETLPITIPANVALVGDELRGAVIQPAIRISTFATQTAGSPSNTVTVASTAGMYDQCPILFVNNSSYTTTSLTLSAFDASILSTTTYYVIGSSITSTTFQISLTPGGSPITLTGGTGLMQVFGGDAVRNMFYMRNGSGLRNVTLVGLLGGLTANNDYLTQRPTGGSYVSLDPGTGTSDTSAWIYRKSPYVQNVTTFGQGATGLKIDGSLHNGGNKSIVCNDFTQVISDGIGIWTTGSGALCEAVSVFSYYGYAGYFAEAGGKIRATNGNSSYGTYGVIAEGFDTSETPITAVINNQYANATATVVSSTSSNLGILRLTYANAGTGYNSAVTNIIQYSNNFLGASWTNDSNVYINQNQTSPDGNPNAWTLQGLTSGTDSAYLSQNVSITATGQTFNNVSGSNITGAGAGATFNISIGATAYNVTVNGGGSGYVVGNTIKVFGSQLGGINGTNDLTITVSGLSGSAINGISTAGTVPAGSAQNYIISAYVKYGSAATTDLLVNFTGTGTRSSKVSLNWSTGVVTPSSEDGNGGLSPTQYGIVALNNSWYRLWMAVYDTSALNNVLQVRLYPRGRFGSAGITYFYGTQVEFGGTSVTAPGFYQSTITRKETGYADYIITGSGINIASVGNETRSNGIYQTRVADTGSGVGGNGYLTSSNNAQGGNTTSIQLSASDTNTASNYTGMRVFILAGTGAGQYGYISYFNATSKQATILKESFVPALVTSASSSLNLLNLDATVDVNSLYINQPIQFAPNYYNTTVTQTSTGNLTITATTGGLNNYFTTSSTTALTVGMSISFSGTVVGGVITNYIYYITNILSSTTFQVSAVYGGANVLLNTLSSVLYTMNYSSGTGYYNGSTSNMSANMPIQFSGTTLGGTVAGTLYYVQDVIDSNTFTISAASVTTTASATAATINQVTVSSVNNLVPCNPIYFSGNGFGGLTSGTKYYIASIPDSTHITLATSLINVIAIATAGTSNLVTVTSTSGFIAGTPIIFSGNSFGGIASETIYYILAVNDATTFTMSATVAGSAINLFTASGQMFGRTTPTALTLTAASGTMTGTTTANKFKPSSGQGSMNALFQTPLFGGLTQGTTYYILSINLGSPNTISLTASSGGSSPVNLITSTGSMQFGWVGWDNVNPGTPIASLLDSTTLYFIESKLTYSAPPFTSNTTSPTVQQLGTAYTGIAYGNGTWIAVANANSTLSSTTDGQIWSTVSLPISSTWSAIAYGNNYWVVLATGSATALVSNSSGQSWRQVSLPSSTTWSILGYGNGTFIAIASGTTTSAYSTNGGVTWTSMSGLSSTVWKSVAYGAGIFVAIAANGTTAYINTNTTALSAGWTIGALPTGTNYSSIAFGNGIFVAIQAVSATPAFSVDGVTWVSSPYSILGTSITYGQGVFVTVNNTSGACYTSEDGNAWVTRSIPNSSWSSIGFGFTSIAGTSTAQYQGLFISVGGTSAGTYISAGARAKGRPNTSSNVIPTVSMFESGSGYNTIAPTLTVFDPNVTSNASFALRTGSGVLASPTFLNRGQGYQISSTSIYINGSGVADNFQTGAKIYIKNLLRLARPGDDVVFAGNSGIYKVTDCTALYGTVAPNIQATIGISPDMSALLSPGNGAAVTIRQLYSQVRLTNHDFLNIGYGDQLQANYPGVPGYTSVQPQNQTIENNYGRVFFTSTDQDGNFKVGNLFGVQQATGTVTLSASQFGLSGLSNLSLGGIAVGGSSVTITQFSTDQTFVANSDTIIPTQRAIKAYLTARLSQGGSNTFTGQTTAGTVVLGGPNLITSTIPAGTVGSSVRMKNTVNFTGSQAGIDGNLMALQFFIQSVFR
jgi:hypothetical protein